MTTTAPIRNRTFDGLRGFALLGLLPANVRGFFVSEHVYFATDFTGRVIDDLVSAFTFVFVQGRFMTLFSVFFGVTFAMFFEREPIERRDMQWVRRMIVLIGIGLCHGLLIWWGDILFVYGVAGLLLLAFRNASPRMLFTVGFGLLVVGFLPTRTMLHHWLGVPMLDGDTLQRLAEAESFRRRQGGLAVHFNETASSWVDGNQVPFAIVLTTLPRMLLGVALWRSGWLQRVLSNARPYAKPMWASLTLAIVNVVLMFVLNEVKRRTGAPVLSPWGMLLLAVYHLAGMSLALFYALAILRLFQREGFWQRALAPFAAVGRLTLTHYLLHSIVFVSAVLVMKNHGLIRPSQWTLPVIALLGLQVVGSEFYLRRFQFGPVEYVWRRMAGRRA